MHIRLLAWVAVTLRMFLSNAKVGETSTFQWFVTLTFKFRKIS